MSSQIIEQDVNLYITPFKPNVKTEALIGSTYDMYEEAEEAA